jgi:hypothetical protein
MNYLRDSMDIAMYGDRDRTNVRYSSEGKSECMRCSSPLHEKAKVCWKCSIPLHFPQPFSGLKPAP